MERSSRSKGSSVRNYFSKAATFSVSNHPHSPGRRSDRGFSGPIVSIIPKEARHRNRSESVRGGEPSSPKISCMGQIKTKRKKKKKFTARERQKEKATERRLFCSCFDGMFRRRVRLGGAPEKEVQEKTEKKWMSTVAPTPASGLSKIRRYQSGRETLGDFNWRKHMEGNRGDQEMIVRPHSGPILSGKGSRMAFEQKESKPTSGLSKLMRHQSGREKLGDFDWTKDMEKNHSDDEDENIFVPHSAPILMTSEPRVTKPASTLSKMRKYRSGRGTLGDFDWKKTKKENDGDEEAKVFAPHSAPIILGGEELVVVLEPKKEVNLWRRREAAPPIPLQIEKI